MTETHTLGVEWLTSGVVFLNSRLNSTNRLRANSHFSCFSASSLAVLSSDFCSDRFSCNTELYMLCILHIYAHIYYI